MTGNSQLEERAVERAGLLARYAEPHRRYHTLEHVRHVLDVVEQLAPEAADLQSVRVAAWFHDAVYLPDRPDNERRSADLAAETLLALGADHVLVAEVARLVLLTADHVVDPGDANGAVLCDADLAVLASPPDRYDAYAAAVRQEYWQVPDDLFAAGRASVLRALSARDPIFATPSARTAMEDAARANLGRELATLTPH